MDVSSAGRQTTASSESSAGSAASNSGAAAGAANTRAGTDARANGPRSTAAPPAKTFAAILGGGRRGSGGGHGGGHGVVGRAGAGIVSGKDALAEKAGLFGESAMHGDGVIVQRKKGEGDGGADGESDGDGDGDGDLGSECEGRGARRPSGSTDESDVLDPAARQAAFMAPPVGTAPIESPAAAEAPVRARSLEELIPALVRKIAWAGDRNKGSVRLELGAGAYAGTTVTVHADGGRVRVELGGTEGPDLQRLRERLDTRLRGHGLDVESVT